VETKGAKRDRGRREGLHLWLGVGQEGQEGRACSEMGVEADGRRKKRGREQPPGPSGCADVI